MHTGIAVQNLRYTYPKTDFSIRVENAGLAPGECVALRGHNGSGKTTLGKLIAGLLKPEDGAVNLFGDDITTWSLGRVGAQIGYLFQEPSRQIFAPVAQEELTFALTLSGMPQAEADEKALAMLDRFELTDIARQSTYTLSRGEKQRLAICAMLLTNPRFLILDEPTTGLDKRRRDILAHMMQELQAGGIGILLISHDARFIDEVAQRELWMEGGVLRANG